MGTPYNGLYGEAATGRGTFFMLQVYERVGLLLVLFLAERFFSGFPVFPSLQKPTFPNSNSIRNARTRLSAPWENKLQITILFIDF